MAETNGKTRLQELLAVETNMENQAGKTRTDLTATFKDKRHLFTERRVTFKPNQEGAVQTTEEQSDIQTSVKSEIEWFAKILAKAIDISHQVDIGNTLARADVIVEGEDTPILKAVPTTSLLQLEKRLKEIHELVVAIPTLDPAKGFKPDTTRGKGVYRAHDINKPRTKKVFVPLVLAPATKEHPAQVKEGYSDEPVGMVETLEWSSLITPAIKADVLDNCDKLIRAVKKARARANQYELDTAGHTVGKSLLDYVFKPLEQ